MHVIKTSLTSVLLVSLLGCASNVSQEMRQGGIESKHLYREAFKTTDRHARDLDIRRAKHMIVRTVALEPYTRHSMNETEQLFKLLPNPKVIIYVYPHLSTRDNAPIPGYTTAVSLYKSDEYALPTELLAQGVGVTTKPVTTPAVKTPEQRILSPEEMSLDAKRIRAANDRIAGDGS